MNFKKDSLKKLKENISREIKIIKEISFLFSHIPQSNIEERKMISAQLKSLQNSLKKTKKNLIISLEKLSISKSLNPEQESKKKLPIIIQKFPIKQFSEIQMQKKLTPITENKLLSQPTVIKKIVPKKINKLSIISEFEKETVKRLKKKDKKEETKKRKKPSKYIKTANKIFNKFSKSLINKKTFRTLRRDLIKSNLQFVPDSYLSLILFTTLISVGGAILLFVLLLFFSISAKLPIITVATEEFGARFIKVFWVLFVVPIATFILMYFYPSLEKKSIEGKINTELPFATIHMSAISGSLVEPSKIFSIIISTKEYPFLEKEFIKLMNEINVYGYDLINALRNRAFNSPSKKLAELFNGLATTITSGGDLTEFFDKRSQTLLFEHRIEKEKKTKASETFMDIYISVVIAAPMILMLLLIMIKIGGLGLALSVNAITLMMILGVGVINVIFITFLHLKQPGE